MRLDTPMGPVGLKIDGSGHLQDRFAGKLAAVMPSAAFGGCRAKGVTLYAHIAVRARQPHLEGPFRMDTLACPEMGRSEEHTSELQSLMRISYDVFCLKKKNTRLEPHDQRRGHAEPTSGRRHTNTT